MSNQHIERRIFCRYIISVPFITACMASLLLFGCSVRTPVTFTKAANYPEVVQQKTVAVYPFEGRYGDIYRAEIEALLVSANLNDNHYFTVVENTRLDSIIKAQRLGSIYDQRTVAKVGNLTGARGIFMGSVTVDTVTDRRYTVTSQKCASKDKDNKCQRWRDVTIPCTQRTASTAFTIRLVSVEKGTQVYNRDVSGKAVSKSCQGNQNLENKETIRKRARQQAYDIVRKDVAPYTVNVSIKLMDETDGINSAVAKGKLKSGLLFAKSGRLDRACELWQQARMEAPDSIAIIYNIGVCAEASGDLVNALALYNEADQNLLEPDPVINDALSRVQSRLKKQPTSF